MMAITFFAPQSFGQQGRHDIGFVVISESKKHIRIFDTFLNQQFPLGWPHR